jgi:hypothetical protein
MTFTSQIHTYLKHVLMLSHDDGSGHRSGTGLQYDISSSCLNKPLKPQRCARNSTSEGSLDENNKVEQYAAFQPQTKSWEATSGLQAMTISIRATRV